MTHEAELRPAFEWTCDVCGRDQFVRAVIPELSEEDRLEMRLDHGLDDDDLGHFMMMPEWVTCRHCGAQFKSVGYENEDTGDEDD